MYKFQFQITQGFVNFDVSTEPFFIEVEYGILNGEVILMDYGKKFVAVFPFIKDCFKLHDQIFKAAVEDSKKQPKPDLFKDMGLTKDEFSVTIYDKVKTA